MQSKLTKMLRPKMAFFGREYLSLRATNKKLHFGVVMESKQKLLRKVASETVGSSQQLHLLPKFLGELQPFSPIPGYQLMELMRFTSTSEEKKSVLSSMIDSQSQTMEKDM
jgi:hypothetical protein